MTSRSVKTRGCFQCSKRRIVCDGAHPTCFKCQKKGIECSGLGRFRFSSGIAARGKLKGCAIPATVSPESEWNNQSPTGVPRPQKIRWKDDGPKRTKRKPGTAGTKAKTYPTVNEVEDRQAWLDSGSQNKSVVPRASEILVAPDTPGEDTRFESLEYSEDVTNQQGRLEWQRSSDPSNADEGERCDYWSSSAPDSRSTIIPWIPFLGPEDRMFLSHFASEVAPVMVIFDNVSNGYRDIFLPLACEDEVLRGAIRAVAAQHLALRHPGFQGMAEIGRAAIISRLRRDSLQATSHSIVNLRTWAILIVLLVGETITGSPEYSHLLRTLLSLMPSLCQIEKTPAYRFLIQQTHMFQFLGQPLLDETQGVDALGFQLDHYLDWTDYELPPDSRHNRVLSVVRQAFIEASQIYILRATTNHDLWNRLESLKQLVSRVDPDEQGAHALVWNTGTISQNG
ncbi:hypothetical protein BDV38DRAFT_270144 [Aspergillus pseudotamarii]|uniref:Zn(2)-C6 fungal-type domain-containing protein n=1 Tax=Aspergillus pseudotamarii TaxID=132259 RepID=A0A5N6SW64_ASPPS|nr:uncharacterized protein BDV38DRAFT_270144 [Aspergillus pseudotamarii]KAE8138928.1 hypothetical protein BDV38DRAFT_270144 [Aspergillus pseudotamarii]